VPHGLSILATSPAATIEALGLIDNPRVVGLQFDNHAAAADVQRWLKHDADWALKGSGADPEVIMAAARSLEASMGQQFRQFMRNFCRTAGMIKDKPLFLLVFLVSTQPSKSYSSLYSFTSLGDKDPGHFLPWREKFSWPVGEAGRLEKP
jgi:hypothetical protein